MKNKTEITAGKPKLKLVGKDGNTFAILGEASKIARQSGWKSGQVDAFLNEAMKGDYDNLLRVCCEYFEVSICETLSFKNIHQLEEYSEVLGLLVEKTGK